MPLTDRVKQIMSWYGSDNPGVRANLVRMMNHGTLAGTGKLVGAGRAGKNILVVSSLVHALAEDTGKIAWKHQP